MVITVESLVIGVIAVFLFDGTGTMVFVCVFVFIVGIVVGQEVRERVLRVVVVVLVSLAGAVVSFAGSQSSLETQLAPLFASFLLELQSRNEPFGQLVIGGWNRWQDGRPSRGGARG